MAGVRVLSGDEAAEHVASLGGAEALRESLRRFGENQQYVETHREKLTARYPDEWVCVSEGRVVAHADSPEDAMRMFRESGAPHDGLVLEHLPTEPVSWLL